MREIMFRGKRLYDGEWVTGNLFISDFEDRFYILCGTRRVTIEYEIDPDTAGQYTGLKDKNGTRIFDGDILGFINKYRNMNDTWKCTVEFVEGAFVCRYIEADGDDLYNHFGNWNVPLVEWEVIGNIHDTPELLEE